ncbi:MAG: hypothetical protein AAB477_02295 [Patescibacteria group bacterium]
MDKRKQNLKESNIEETSLKDGASSVSLGENTINKAGEFFKSQVPSKPEVQGALESSKKIVNNNIDVEVVKQQLLNKYPPDEDMDGVLKNEKTGTNKVVTRDQLFKKERENIFKKFWNFIKRNRRKAMVTGIATGISMASMAGNKTAEGVFGDTTNTKSANLKDTMDTKDSPLPLYTKSKTKEGAITPTGLNNSFFNNESNIKPGDLGKIAQKYGFRINNVLNFQTDLFAYLEKNKPEVIKRILEKYDQTAAGTLLDGKLGARTKIALEALLEGGGEVEIVNVEPEKPEVKIETDWNTFKTKGFKKAYAFFDKSPSMEQNKEELGNYILTATEQEIPMRVIGFTDVADTVLDAKNLKEGVENIKKMKTVNKTKELGIDVIIKEMQEKKDAEKAIALYASDEEFQDLTKLKLEEMAKIEKEKNVEFIFYVKINGKKNILSLNDLIAAFDQEWETRGRDIDIKNTKQGIINFQNELERTTDKKEIKEIKKNIAIFENRLKNFEKINVENFAITKKIGKDLTNAPNTTSFNSGIDISKNK